MDWTKLLTEEANELNLPKSKLKDRLLQISSLYSITNPLLWSQKMSADEKERFKPILILVQIELPKNELTAYQESTFRLLPTPCLTFRQIRDLNYLKDAHSCIKIVISCMNMCSTTSATVYLHI